MLHTKKMFHFEFILNFDALYDKYAEKILHFTLTF